MDPRPRHCDSSEVMKLSSFHFPHGLSSLYFRGQDGFYQTSSEGSEEIFAFVQLSPGPLSHK